MLCPSYYYPLPCLDTCYVITFCHIVQVSPFRPGGLPSPLGDGGLGGSLGLNPHAGGLHGLGGGLGQHPGGLGGLGLDPHAAATLAAAHPHHSGGRLVASAKPEPIILPPGGGIEGGKLGAAEDCTSLVEVGPSSSRIE